MLVARGSIILFLGGLLLACGSDGGDSGGGGTAGSGGTSGTAGTAGTGSSGGGTTGGTTGAGSGSGAGSSTGAGSGGTGGTVGGSGGSGSTGGLDCEGLAPGPFDPEVVSTAFDGSEDLAIDNMLHLAAKAGNDVLLMDPGGDTMVLASVPGETLGLRFGLGGDLYAAQRQQGKLVRITPGGQVSDFATGLGGPNGVFPDLDGNIWVTDFSGDRVLRLDADATVTEVVTGAEATLANGIVYDPDRGLLFYTNYGSGRIASVTIDGDTFGAPTEVTTVPGAPDGLAMDVCGHLYVVDNQGSDLYRVRLDPGGAADGPPELLASYPTNIANPHFGRAPGFCETCLYAAGKPGTIYRIDLGIFGAQVP